MRSLAKLFAWDHDFERIHRIACWDIGKVKSQYTLKDGSTVRYQKDGDKHSLVWERKNGISEVIPVYVLSEMLGATE
ncbi:MAG: hypothetical protein M1144_02375 [Candidatus Thermoplasmatota archaeon]|nr:hypothetical protein [Candidatus Thermoplasmatota archaeon]